MKKMILALLLTIVMLLAGCGNSADVETPGTNETPGATAPGERKTITIGIPKYALVMDYDTNAYTLWLEEQSGYNIEIVPYASGSGDYSNQLATETGAGKELPDILWHFRLSSDLIERYGEDGFFIDLSEYFEDREKSANYWRMTEKYLTEEEQDRIWMLLHSEDRTSTSGSEGFEGPIYGYPSTETTMIDTMDFMPLINRNWLDALKLEVPKTLDELVEVLRAFKTRDPNGNGKNDEIPMLGPTGGLGSCTIDWLINFFIYHNDANYFNVDKDGKLYYPQTDDRYRDALKFIRGLIEEGLLNSNVLSYNWTKMRNVLMQTDQIGVTVIHPSLGFNEENDSLLKWEALNLYGNVYYNTNQFYRDVFITDSCDDPDAAWDLLMHMCTEEAAFRMRYGEYGVHWEWADEGATSVMGIPAIIKVKEDIWSTTNNSTWMVCVGGVYPYSENEVTQATGDESPVLKHKYKLYQDLRTNYDAALEKVDQTLVCPWLYFNDEEDEIAENRSFLKKEVTSWRDNFLNGSKNIDTQWDEYLAALQAAGSKQYLDAAQMCYDRVYKSGT